MAKSGQRGRSTSPAQTILLPALMSSSFSFHNMYGRSDTLSIKIAGRTKSDNARPLSAQATDNDKIGNSASQVR